MIARETVGQVLAEPCGGGEAPVTVTEERSVPVPVRGSVVPVWREQLEVAVLAPDYRRLMDILAGRDGPGGDAMDCRQLAAALGLQPVPTKVEGCGRRPSA